MTGGPYGETALTQADAFSSSCGAGDGKVRRESRHMAPHLRRLDTEADPVRDGRGPQGQVPGVVLDDVEASLQHAEGNVTCLAEAEADARFQGKGEQRPSVWELERGAYGADRVSAFTERAHGALAEIQRQFNGVHAYI